MEMEKEEGGRGEEEEEEEEEEGMREGGGVQQDGERLPAHTVKAVNIRCGDKAPQTNTDQIRHFSSAARTVSQPERQTNNQHSTPDKGSTGRVQEIANLQPGLARRVMVGKWRGGGGRRAWWWSVKGLEEGVNVERQQVRRKWPINAERTAGREFTAEDNPPLVQSSVTEIRFTSNLKWRYFQP